MTPSNLSSSTFVIFPSVTIKSDEQRIVTLNSVSTETVYKSNDDCRNKAPVADTGQH